MFLALWMEMWSYLRCVHVLFRNMMARQGSRNSTIVLGSALHDDFAAMALVLRRENLARSAAAENYKNIAVKAWISREDSLCHASVHFPMATTMTAMLISMTITSMYFIDDSDADYASMQWASRFFQMSNDIS